jgi:hypothetical protein
MLVVEDDRTGKDDLRRAWELLGRERNSWACRYRPSRNGSRVDAS